MGDPDREAIRDFVLRGPYPRLRVLFSSTMRRSADPGKASTRPPGYSPPLVDVETSRGVETIAVRDVDLPLLCQPDADGAKRHLSQILAARGGDRVAGEQLAAEIEKHYRLMGAGSWREPVEGGFVVPCSSRETHSEVRISHKGSILLKLSQLGYPVPDFVILTSEAYADWQRQLELHLTDALEQLQALTFKRLGSADNPLVFAIRCAMPCYAPGVMPTYLNVGVTQSALAGLGREVGQVAAEKMFLNNLRNIYVALDGEGSSRIASSIGPDLSSEETAALIEEVSQLVRQRDERLLDDGLYQAAFLLGRAYRYFEANRDLLETLSRGTNHYPSMILQEMICTVRQDEAYAGVIFSRNPQTGTGRQLETARNLFGEEIMTGSAATKQTAFEDREEIRESFPAVHHFSPHLADLEREFQSPVTIELAVDATRRHQLFALLQLNEAGMSGRGAFISVVDLHKSGAISRKRVTQLIRPYHVKQIESDTIDSSTFDILDRFCSGVPILPRSAVSARLHFAPEDALRAKKRGEKVCFCQRVFVPNDTVVMREMDAIVSLTSAAIHVTTICNSFGIPGLLSIDRDGVSMGPDERSLVSASGRVIRDGDWITLSSRRNALYSGRAAFQPARLLRLMRGEPVAIGDDEKAAFDAMAYAYRYYQQLVRGLKLDQISTLAEVIRLVNLELRGEAEEARRLVNGWFDRHEELYVEEIFNSEMGDHLNQSTVYDMLALDQKIRFFKKALARCARDRVSGYAAGAFMLGRFLCMPSSIAFWRAFDARETGLLVNEWVLFEKYMQVLHEVGERKIVRARKKILSEGLDELFLHPGNVKLLIPLKLAGNDLELARRSLPQWCDPQASRVLELLQQPYRAFYDFGASWSFRELEEICAAESMPLPGPDDT